MTRIYKLDITYPGGSAAPGWQPEGWQPGGPFTSWAETASSDDDPSFRWPVERHYLSRSGATDRAVLLRQCGCTVDVVASHPVAWNEDGIPGPGGTPEQIPAAEGRRIVEAADWHPRRNLIYALAETTSDLDGESGAGGGMWWHLSRALAIVDTIPDLRADQP